MQTRYATYDDRYNEVYLPIEDAQTGCDGDCVTCAPGNCGKWRDSVLVCPACLEFKERAYPLPKFTEYTLLVHKDGRFLCLECGEVYRDAADLAARAVAYLKDALDDQAWDAAQMEEFAEESA